MTFKKKILGQQFRKHLIRASRCFMHQIKRHEEKLKQGRIQLESAIKGKEKHLVIHSLYETKTEKLTMKSIETLMKEKSKDWWTERSERCFTRGPDYTEQSPAKGNTHNDTGWHGDFFRALQMNC